MEGISAQFLASDVCPPLSSFLPPFLLLLGHWWCDLSLWSPQACLCNPSKPLIDLIRRHELQPYYPSRNGNQSQRLWCAAGSGSREPAVCTHDWCVAKSNWFHFKHCPILPDLVTSKHDLSKPSTTTEPQCTTAHLSVPFCFYNIALDISNCRNFICKLVFWSKLSLFRPSTLLYKRSTGIKPTISEKTCLVWARAGP